MSERGFGLITIGPEFDALDHSATAPFNLNRKKKLLECKKYVAYSD